MTQLRRVYLAGPEVFLPDAVAVGQRKKQICAAYGLTGLFPLDDEVAAAAGSTRIDILIFRNIMAIIGEADLGIVNLTPFRGPSADVGSVFELGLLVGLGKPVFGYTNESADLLDRVRSSTTALLDPAEGSWRDACGMTIEDFGNADNLMIDCALAEQNYPIVRPAVSADDLFRDLAGFEACVRMAAAHVGLTARRVAGVEAG